VPNTQRDADCAGDPSLLAGCRRAMRRLACRAGDCRGDAGQQIARGRIDHAVRMHLAPQRSRNRQEVSRCLGWRFSDALFT